MTASASPSSTSPTGTSSDNPAESAVSADDNQAPEETKVEATETVCEEESYSESDSAPILEVVVQVDQDSMRAEGERDQPAESRH